MSFKLNIGLLVLSFSLAIANLDGNKAPVYAPVDTCKADGVTLIDPSKADSGQSGCNGGDQFTCNCMQPFNDQSDSSLALGFAAFTSGSEAATDCACYYAKFAHDGQGKPIKRNKLIFQVTNTGGDVQSENIDFQIPGGGLGAFTQGCSAQWGVPASMWGQTYGGVQSASECSHLPKPLQEGCKWRFTSWGDNPVLKGAPKRVRCPKSLIDRSGCQRKDDNTVSAYSGKTDGGNTAAPAQYKRNRSVCLGGGKKEGYSSSDNGGAQDKPVGYGSGSDGSSDNSGNGAGKGTGYDAGSNDSGSQDDKPAPAPASDYGPAPQAPSSPKGHHGHHSHKGHRGHKKQQTCSS